MKKLAPALVGIALIVGAGSFYGGFAYAQGKSPRGGAFNRPAGMGANGGMNGDAAFGGRGQGGSGAARMGGLTAGEILSKDDASITVKLMDGGSKLVFLSNGTKITKTSEAAPEDLAVGAQVVVMGQAGTDGSVTASSIQLGGGFGFGRPAGGERQPAR